jgi:AcrR family transcriptional regulator
MNRTKRKILTKAMELFSEKGYEATSVDEITEKAGIAKRDIVLSFL